MYPGHGRELGRDIEATYAVAEAATGAALRKGWAEPAIGLGRFGLNTAVGPVQFLDKALHQPLSETGKDLVVSIVSLPIHLAEGLKTIIYSDLHFLN